MIDAEDKETKQKREKSGKQVREKPEAERPDVLFVSHRDSSRKPGQKEDAMKQDIDTGLLEKLKFNYKICLG